MRGCGIAGLTYPPYLIPITFLLMSYHLIRSWCFSFILVRAKRRERRERLGSIPSLSCAWPIKKGRKRQGIQMLDHAMVRYCEGSMESPRSPGEGSCSLPVPSNPPEPSSEPATIPGVGKESNNSSSAMPGERIDRMTSAMPGEAVKLSSMPGFIKPALKEPGKPFDELRESVPLRLLEPHHVIAFCDDGDGVGAASGSGQPAGSESPRSLTASEQSYLREILGEDQGGIRDLDQAAIRSDLKRKDQSYGSDLASSYKQPPPRQASKGHMRAQRTSKRALDLTTGAMEQVVLV
ncbi:hypothetical protein V6N13_057145 [Hibiscus sabdariffa]